MSISAACPTVLSCMFLFGGYVSTDFMDVAFILFAELVLLNWCFAILKFVPSYLLGRLTKTADVHGATELRT